MPSWEPETSSLHRPSKISEHGHICVKNGDGKAGTRGWGVQSQCLRPAFGQAKEAAAGITASN